MRTDTKLRCHPTSRTSPPPWTVDIGGWGGCLPRVRNSETGTTPPWPHRAPRAAGRGAGPRLPRWHTRVRGPESSECCVLPAHLPTEVTAQRGCGDEAEARTACDRARAGQHTAGEAWRQRVAPATDSHVCVKNTQLCTFELGMRREKF